MAQFYLERSTHTKFTLTILFCLLFGFTKILFFLLLIYGMLLIFLRKKKSVYLEEQVDSKKGLPLSPVSGKVLNIRKNINHKRFGENMTELRISSSPLEEAGHYLPMTSELVERWEGSLSEYIPRFSFYQLSDKDLSDKGKMLKFKADNGDTYGMHFLRCPFGGVPELWMMPGDRGRRQVNMGLTPLGGTVLLYIPGNYEILVKKNQSVLSGDTVVGARET